MFSHLTFRYTVTIAGTTYSIRYLNQTGYKTSDELKAVGKVRIQDEWNAKRDQMREWQTAWENFAKKRRK